MWINLEESLSRGGDVGFPDITRTPLSGQGYPAEEGLESRMWAPGCEQVRPLDTIRAATPFVMSAFQEIHCTVLLSVAGVEIRQMVRGSVSLPGRVFQLTQSLPSLIRLVTLRKGAPAGGVRSSPGPAPVHTSGDRGASAVTRPAGATARRRCAFQRWGISAITE